MKKARMGRDLGHLFRRLKRPALPSIFRRTSPLSNDWGFDRGTPIDRYYIENFLREYRQDIAGQTLEVADSRYTERFGTGVTQSDVLDIDRSNELATLIADLSAPGQIPSSVFDCFILTQTLHLIYDVQSAIDNANRLLRPGGVLLATVPAVSRTALDEIGDYWRFTAQSCSRLFAASFGGKNTSVKGFGNIAACIAFLQGMAYEELPKKLLMKNDEAFPLVIGIRAVKTR